MNFPRQCLVERTPDALDLPLPARQTAQSAGVDLHSNITVTLEKGGRILIPTGIKIALPFGYEAQVRSRSGLALKHGVAVLNSPGTVDADFRGEVKVLLINHGSEDFHIKRGDRIAQLVFAKVEMLEFSEVSALPETERADGGYGSTGVNKNA